MINKTVPNEIVRYLDAHLDKNVQSDILSFIRMDTIDLHARALPEAGLFGVDNLFKIRLFVSFEILGPRPSGGPLLQVKSKR